VSDSKNMILAVALSALVLIGWGLVTETWFPTANPPVTKIEDGKEVVLPQPQASPAGADTASAVRNREQVLRESAGQRVAIATPRLAGTINLRGARVDDLVLLNERETIDPASPPVRLFSPSGTPQSYFGEFGWIGAQGAVPTDATLWQSSGGRLTPETPVTLSWDNGRGQLFQILLSVDADYMFRAEQRIVNRGPERFTASPYALVSRVGGTHAREHDSWTVHIGPMGVFDGAANYSNNFDTVSEAGQVRFDSNGGWIGFTDQYWLAAVVPVQGASPIAAEFRHVAGTDRFQASYVAQPVSAAPGRAAVYTSRLFAGAKEVQLLDRYSAELGTPLEQAIDWGWFEWFMIPIFALLNWLFLTIGNFGVAIIALTLIVRLLLFPIAQKQFASFAKMRVIQPKMKALQERHADDKPRLQQEMLKLYKEEKVNPMQGCLPILLQIPIFYALYKVLLVSVEMRHEPFALWIRDLSAPDPLSPVNLFGYLDFTPPSLLAIGILPILLGITMWLQFKLNPQMPDPVQRQIFALMPWILMFAMATFAAGLQLYWVTNNILTIAQQKWLYMRHPTPAAPEPIPLPQPPPSAAGSAGPRKGKKPPRAR